MIAKPIKEPITDQMRIQFITGETYRNGVCAFKRNHGQNNGTYELFTVSAQYQYGDTIREVIDKSMLYEPSAPHKTPEWFNSAIVNACEAGVEAYIKAKKDHKEDKS